MTVASASPPAQPAQLDGDTFYTAYRISEAARADLLSRFPPGNGFAGLPLRPVCNHVTRCFPAPAGGEDGVPPCPDIVVIGHFLDAASGHQVLAVTVDGALHRPDGGYYHITLALDDRNQAARERKAAGLPRATAMGSMEVLKAAVAAARSEGVDGETALFTLPPEQRCRVAAEYSVIAAGPRSVLRPDGTVVPPDNGGEKSKGTKAAADVNLNAWRQERGPASPPLPRPSPRLP